MPKRTTIELDEDLLARAKLALGEKTTRGVVEEALRRAAEGAEVGSRELQDERSRVKRARERGDGGEARVGSSALDVDDGEAREAGAAGELFLREVEGDAGGGEVCREGLAKGDRGAVLGGTLARARAGSSLWGVFSSGHRQWYTKTY